MLTTHIDDDVLELLLDQRFETDHGILPTRDATAAEIELALQHIRIALARLVDRRSGTTDPDRLDHLIARIAALAEQTDELQTVLAWTTAQQTRAGMR